MGIWWAGRKSAKGRNAGLLRRLVMVPRNLYASAYSLMDQAHPAMLFNSYEFIFGFLPICLGVFFALGRYTDVRVALGWLVACSLFFYGWWNPAYLGLIVISMIFNFIVGTTLAKRAGRPGNRLLLLFGTGVNLGLIGYLNMPIFLSKMPTPWPERAMTLAPFCCRWRFRSSPFSRSRFWLIRMPGRRRNTTCFAIACS